MPPFDECCVLIPAATLEDFPAKASDCDARSLLAAWTVLWHPALLAAAEQIPVWYRADSPPEPTGRRLIVIPTSSMVKLPEGYTQRVEQSDGCRWISGADRNEMLIQLSLDPLPPLQWGGRSVEPADFFAAGLAALQVQVMTRRLRYTSNLDEIHLQNRLVDAAKAAVAGDAQATVAALHDVFDCLAEERDHYFSSDPHLIDLTLVTDTTLDGWISTLDQPSASTNTITVEPITVDPAGIVDGQTGDNEAADNSVADNNPQAAILATPANVLIDAKAATAIAQLEPTTAERIRQRLRSGDLGWAGGGPDSDARTDAMTFAQAETVFREAYRHASEALGSPPPVYGRLSGPTPADMTATLAGLGYAGVIPLDFAAGTGHGDEAKVILQAAGVEIEALTAKPIDAASDAAFLALGARLGEAIDSGEIATALLVHWPGGGCDSFHDLRRLASWSLSLGRFWKLDDYFREGEHPYHHGTTQAASPAAADLLLDAVGRNSGDPLSTLASEFRNQVVRERDAMLQSLTQLVTGKEIDQDAITQFANTLGTNVDPQAPARLLINPHNIGCRQSVSLQRMPPPSKHLFAASSDRHGVSATVDIPACGFVVIGCQGTCAPGPSLGKRIRRKLFGGTTTIAEHGRLENEFMEVTISDQSGGLSGVFSGSSRGNRLSMRLIACQGNTKAKAKAKASDEAKGDQEPIMRCEKLRVAESTAAVGSLESVGQLLDHKQKPLADFTLRYTLRRGSRVIEIDGELRPLVPLAADPWQHYFAARVAIAGEAPTWRLLLRDKIHRAAGRRLVAPLGVLIDEGERQTLVSGGGLAFHRRVGERFLDTLLHVHGETEHKFSLRYGLDVPSPVASAKTWLAPPVQVPIQATDPTAEIGWLLHAAPKDIVLSELRVARRDDGRMAALVRVMQTRSQTCKATLRFLRDVEFAFRAGDIGSDAAVTQQLNRPLPEGEQNGNLDCKKDSVSIPLASHGVADIVVVFTS